MTQIQKSKQMIRIMLYPTASSQADLGLQNDAIQLRGMFWTLKIEIWDLFVIWWLRFGILLSH
jgi:hypothetical protein